MLAPRIAADSSDVKSRFLDGLSTGELETVLAAARRRRYLARSVVVNQGTPADHLFLLKSGRARYFYTTEDGRKLLLLWLTPGEIFGGAALLSTQTSYLVSTETVRDSSLLMWDRSTMRDLASRCPRLLENALLFASSYLTWYVAAHVALSGQKARERLAQVLICLAGTIGQKVSAGLEFDATNEELASAANITRFTASRLMSEWQGNRAVAKRRGKILLRSPEKLFLHTA
jgi:CRP/FNR family transcriptional regulator, nitrogen oxide reductase regulator